MRDATAQCEIGRRSPEERTHEADLLKYVKCLLSVQRNRLPQFRSPTWCSSLALDRDDVQLFHLMKSRLDYQLDAILQRYVASVDTAEKTETRNHSDCRGMDALELWSSRSMRKRSPAICSSILKDAPKSTGKERTKS